MIVRDLGAAGRWLIVACAYASDMQAKRAWEHAESKLSFLRGDAGLALMRIKGNSSAGCMRSGVDGRAAVMAVTLDETTATKCDRLLAKMGGEVFEPTEEFADALIYRRVRVVTQHAGETGRLKIRRPDGAGIRLDRWGREH